MDIFIIIIYGILLGYIINYLADILPTQRKLAAPLCQHCQQPRSLADYILLKPCTSCQQKRTLRTYIVLIVMLATTTWQWYAPHPKMGFWLSGLVLAYFLMIVVIDFEHHLILHVTTLGGAILGLAVGIINVGFSRSLIGGLSNAGIMLVFYLLGMAFARYRAKRMGNDDGEEALGFGDVTISAVLGLMLGWPLSWVGLVYGILIAGVFSLLLIIYLIATKRFQTMGIYTAYGPYLVAGTFLLLFLRPIALKWLG